MKHLNRDLLLVTKKTGLNQTELEQTIVGLDSVLHRAENFAAICTVNEIIDLNKYKIYNRIKDVAYYINHKSNKPYIFISNKN